MLLAIVPVGILCFAEQEEVFLYGEEISVDATEKEEEVKSPHIYHARSLLNTSNVMAIMRHSSGVNTTVWLGRC